MNNSFCDFIVNHHRYLLLTALVFFVSHWFLGYPGIISVFAVLSLGASGGSFGSYLTERGLWMASALFLLIACVIFFPLLISYFVNLKKNFNAGTPLMFDLGIGSAIFVVQIVFLSIATYKNAKI